MRDHFHGCVERLLPLPRATNIDPVSTQGSFHASLKHHHPLTTLIPTASHCLLVSEVDLLGRGLRLSSRGGLGLLLSSHRLLFFGELGLSVVEALVHRLREGRSLKKFARFQSASAQLAFERQATAEDWQDCFAVRPEPALAKPHPRSPATQHIKGCKREAHLGLEAARNLAEVLAKAREVLGAEDQRADHPNNLVRPAPPLVPVHMTIFFQDRFDPTE